MSQAKNIIVVSGENIMRARAKIDLVFCFAAPFCFLDLSFFGLIARNIHIRSVTGLV